MKSTKKDNQEILPEKVLLNADSPINPEKPVKGGFYIVGDQVQDANGQPIPGWTVVNGEAVKNEGKSG